MTKIQNETAYKATMERIEELLPLVDDNTPLSYKNLIELDLLSGLVEEYEDEHYPIKSPSLADIMKLRMYEMGLSQAKLSELLGVSPSRISDYFTGRSEPTFIIKNRYYSFRSFNSQAKALAPSTAASESFSSETSNLVLPL